MKRLGLGAMLAVAGCAANVQQDAERAFAQYRGRPISTIMAAWGSPVSEGVNENGPVYTFSGAAPSQSISTASTTGAIGTVPFSATTSTFTPITIYCRVHVFTNTRRQVIGFENDGAKGACSEMYRQLR